ncbi:Na(+)/citrate cotransporter-like isoform X2 [Hippocampus zosterae]|uniref:Na(+)/citrate cotransporter-like isoform X2 n=2 Tax=Hippocampus zosterae TaxID=109293 RepID=UPI00223DDCA8|nr:Na(+)/citrate cotransporter-like isoform X2 [Hippocampus zosterae]
MAALRAPVRLLRAVWRQKGVWVVALAPLVLLPLALSTKEAACAYVILLMALYWCTEVLPLAVTALLPTILFPLLGIMRSKDVCMQYLRDSNMLFVGGLMVAVAVEHWNLHKRIALKVLLVVGVRPALLMLGFMSVTAFLSMWISNTATAAMMVPIVQAVLDQLRCRDDAEEGRRTTREGAADPASAKQSACVVRMPDVEASGRTGECEERTGEGGAPTTTCEDVTVSTLKPPPQDQPASAPKASVSSAVCASEADGADERRKRLSKGLLLSVCYAASIGGIATLTGTGPNLVLLGQMSQLFPQSGGVINSASWFAFAFPTMLMMLFMAWILLQQVFIGRSPRGAWSCGRGRPAKERAARDAIEEEQRRLGRMSYGEASVMALFLLMVVLWFTREPRFVDGWASRAFNADGEFVTDATVSLFVALLLFILPSQPPKYLLCWRRSSDADAQVCPGPAPPLLTWKVAQAKIPWNIVLLLGGGFALAKGSEESGLSRWLGSQMTPLHSIPPWAITVVLCLLTATFTECASNVATATLLLPILASMSQSISVNPLYVMIPCTLSASFAFMLPVATPPNAIVFSSGYLKVADMAKTGVVMNVIGIACISVAINTWGRVLFSLDSFPEWANGTTHI